MMQYGIITHYDVHNHGAVLQLNALSQVLKQNFQIEAKALQFDKNYDFLGIGMKAKYNISLRSAGIYLDYLRHYGLSRTLFNVKKKKLLDDFKRKNRLIGPYYTECGALDGVVVGSDEVFALHTGPSPVFFGHACPSDRVFTYAGSFGPTTLQDIQRLHCEAFVRSGLESMKGLGMRDRNSAEIARELTGKEVPLVADPVILYGYEKEIASFASPGLPPYLLVYAYDRNMNEASEVERIRAFARKKGLKIVSPGFYHAWADYNVNVGPVELLRYFKYAECVVTDTFHGSVMSIITNRNLAVTLRGNGNKLFNLLQEYGLVGRILADGRSLEDVCGNDVDYDSVRKEIVRRRAHSMDYLSAMVKG